jgi:hypothetical protein
MTGLPLPRHRRWSILLAAGIGACSRHGVVGVTSSSHGELDASAGRSDAAGIADASFRSDAIAPGPIHLDDCLPVNAANLAPAAAQQLIDGTGDATAIRVLYPYEGTVYPQGIPGPTLMWSGPAADIVYVRLHSRSFDYRGCLKPTGPNRLDLPSGIWDLAGASTRGADDPFTLELKLLGAETIYGPVSEQIVVANAAVKGSVYYMTNASPAAVGGIMRVRAGRAAEVLLAPPSCAGCHSVSANGARLVAFQSAIGSSFTLSASPPLTPLAAPLPGGEFAGLYPDGSVYVASAHVNGGGPRTYASGVAEAGLYDTATGMLITGSAVPTGACMPSFSPDGRRLAFTDFGASQGHTLAWMQFSIEQRAASGYQTLLSATRFVGWPTFLPDGSAVVFTQGDASDFSGLGAGLIPVVVGPATDLFIVDTTIRTTTLLAQAMGFRSAQDLEAGQTYLPGGTADLHQNYYPSLSPVAAGGYAWLFFDSNRSYGNQPAHRSIWCTAVSLSADGTYRTDPSHPAFYWPGQDPNSPNFRAIAAPDP